MKAKLIKILKKMRNFLPSPVPLGIAEFEAWASDIISTYDFPNNDSVRFALATMILHSGPTAAFVSKRYFSLMVKAGAAKQIASQVFQDIKIKQQAEATASQVASSVQQPVQN
jgi:hypothetical protein